MPFTRAQKRYNKSVLLMMTGYILILLGCVSYAKAHGPLGGPEGYLIALLPAFPIIGVFAVMGRYLVDETDEYIRSRFVRQALIATGLTLSVATAWGFLENFDLVPHVYTYYAAILWFGCQGLVAIGACVPRLFGRGGGE